jgi:phage tail-like protein
MVNLLKQFNIFNEYPMVGYHFHVFFPAFMTDCRFSEVTGLNMHADPETFLEGGINSAQVKLPGRTTYDDLVLKRGRVSRLSPLTTWFQTSMGGGLLAPVIPQPIVINLLDENRIPTMSWFVVKAFPIALEYSTLNATATGDSALLIETLKLSYSSFFVV